MTIKGKKIEFISAKIHYEYFGKKEPRIRQIVDCELIVNGTPRKVYKKSEDTSDLKAKVEAFKSGKIITELTL